MQAAKAGDRAALTGLYERYRLQVYHLCHTILRDHALAEDATHDTFERALGALDRFDVGRPIWPWLSTIARRLCIDTIRVRGRAIPVDDLNGDASRYADATSDAPLEDVLSAEERDVLVRALAGLPSRQRRAVLLYALEGWQYADIASAEGISVAALKSTIWRARASLRRTCRSGPLSVVVVPIVLGVRAARRASLRLRSNMVGATEAIAGAGLQGMQAAAFGLVLLLGGAGVSPVPVDGDGVATPGQEMLALANAGVGSGHPTSAGGEYPQPSPVDELERVADEVSDPTKGATPEDTQFTSFAVSPDYARDRTIYATGAIACYRPTSCQVLFVSKDGGASWERLPAEGFFGTKILLPPNYPDDPRIYTIGFAGLQLSEDGGETFEVLVPTPSSEDAAISPMFDQGDPRILIGWHAVLEYRADSGEFDAVVIGPTGMAAPTSVAFSPLSVDDFVVGEARADESGQMWGSFVTRCGPVRCTEHRLDEAIGVPSFRPGDDVVYAFTQSALYALDPATDRIASRTVPTWGKDGKLLDLVVLPGGDLIAATHFSEGPLGGLSRSSDGGRTWTPVALDAPAFSQGAVSLAVTPTGRVIASAAAGGIACSNDGGASWSVRCDQEAR